MSTKCTLDHGDGFHAYAELFDPARVYLELEGVEFAATPRGVVVAIPLEVWERLRKVAATAVRAVAMAPDEADEADEAGLGGGR